MKPPTQIYTLPTRLRPPRTSLTTNTPSPTLLSQNLRTCPSCSKYSPSERYIHSSTPPRAAVEHALNVGPPPDPPHNPALEHVRMLIARKKRRQELLKQAQEIKAGGAGAAILRDGGRGKRFWNEVSVKEVDGSYQIHLDTHPILHPTTDLPLQIPLSKPNLAAALALEWDNLDSNADTKKNHLLPLTSLVAHAIDIRDSDLSDNGQKRKTIAAMLLRYLDTDTLLCWAPSSSTPATSTSNAAANVGKDYDVLRNEEGETLRDVQERTATEISNFLTRHVWPGVVIKPALAEGSIMPTGQDKAVRDVVMGWVLGLDAWELAGLERATLAGKGLLVAARLVVEWGEGSWGLRQELAEQEEVELGEVAGRFGVEEGAAAASLEVDWQTGKWGVVEDTHDVDREDVRRHFGGVVLLVSGVPEGSRPT